MDKAAGALDPRGPAGELIPPFGPQPDDLYALGAPPSDYLTRFWYDCCTYSGPILRFVIDTVGIDRVVLGSDYPAPMVLADAVNWVMDLPELSRFEKEAILSTNPAALFGL
jgi:aminocarboxymuconate-semialdehyde decarboxylase